MEPSQSRSISNANLGDASQRNVYGVSQGISLSGTIRGTSLVSGSLEVRHHIEIDMEVSNLLNWLAEQQGISPELALKKAVVTAAYIHDLTTSQGGKLLVQRKDNSVGEIVLK
jgi:hypothetical protein